MHEAVENGVGDGGVAYHFIPVVDRDLAGDDRRAPLVAVLEDLQKITSLLAVELLRSPIIEDEQIGSGERVDQSGVTSVPAGQREGGEEAENAVVGAGKILISEAQAGQLLPTPAGPMRSRLWCCPVATRQLEEEIAVEAAGGVEVDVLDLGVTVQFCGARPRLEALLAARRHLPLEQKGACRPVCPSNAMAETSPALRVSAAVVLHVLRDDSTDCEHSHITCDRVTIKSLLMENKSRLRHKNLVGMPAIDSPIPLSAPRRCAPLPCPPGPCRLAASQTRLLSTPRWHRPESQEYLVSTPLWAGC